MDNRLLDHRYKIIFKLKKLKKVYRWLKFENWGEKIGFIIIYAITLMEKIEECGLSLINTYISCNEMIFYKLVSSDQQKI
jgi:hypothetical protein